MSELLTRALTFLLLCAEVLLCGVVALLQTRNHSLVAENYVARLGRRCMASVLLGHALLACRRAVARVVAAHWGFRGRGDAACGREPLARLTCCLEMLLQLLASLESRALPGLFASRGGAEELLGSVVGGLGWRLSMLLLAPVACESIWAGEGLSTARAL